MTRINPDKNTWTCPKCGATVDGNFCSSCGQKKIVPEEKICKCGFKNSKDAKFCAQCGSSLQAEGRKKNKNKKNPIVVLAVCGLLLAALVWSFLKPHEHKWEDATCTDPQICKTCGETKGSASGHRWDKATCTDPKTCRICKETSGSATGHSWSEATCTEPKTCSVCGETSGSAGSHSWKDATCTDPKTCSICGETSGSELGHSWKDATYDAPKTCTVCGVTSGSAKVREGYTAKLSGTSQKVTLKNGNSTLNVHAQVYSKKITNCRQLTVNMDVEMKNGTSCYDWQIWGRTNGTFKVIGSIYLPDGDGYVSQTVYFSDPVSFDAIVVTPTIPGGYSWALGFIITDVWCNS